MTMSAPAAVTSLAARSLVAMPPVPSAEPAPPARASISGVIALHQRRAACASGWVWGSAVYRPSMSLEQHQQVRLDAAAHDGGQGVVVADRAISSVATVSFSLMMGRAPSSSRRVRVFSRFCRRPASVNVLAGEQDLGHGVVVIREQPVVGVHQLALAHGGGRPAWWACPWGGWASEQLAHAHADGAGGHQDDLMPGVLQVAEYLDQLFGVADVQPPGGVRQRGSADFDDDSHILTPFPSLLSDRKRQGRRPSRHHGTPVLPIHGRLEWCCRRGCTRHPSTRRGACRSPAPCLALPSTIWAAYSCALARGRPQATPPSASASMNWYTQAGPQPETQLAASIRVSGTGSEPPGGGHQLAEFGLFFGGRHALEQYWIIPSPTAQPGCWA